MLSWDQPRLIWAHSKLPLKVIACSFGKIVDGLIGQACRIRCSVVVSVSARHAEGPGSIPGGGALGMLR